MEPDEERTMKEHLVLFREEIESMMDDDLEGYLDIWENYPMDHLENLLRDKIIVYMGDKESEREGTEEDVLEMSTLCYLLWARKRNEHLI